MNKKTTSTELVVRNPSKDLLVLSDKVAEIVGYNPVREIFNVGNRVNAMVQLLQHAEMVSMLEKLENTPSGFLTDKKDGAKYPAAIRAQAILDCVAQGGRVTRNEINIIRGKGMLVKNFYYRMLWELGHVGSQSEACAYQMDNWYSKESIIEKGSGLIKFNVSIKGTWTVKKSGEVKPFDWSTEISLGYGGSFDTIDNSQGKAQRRAWKEFYERWSGQSIPENNIEFNPKTIEPSVTTGSLEDAMSETLGPEAVEVKPKVEPKVEPKAVEVKPKVEPKAAEAKPKVEPKAAEAKPKAELGPDTDDLF